MFSQSQMKRITKQITRDFPEFKGVKPKITEKKIRPQDKLYKKLSLGVAKEFRRVYQLSFRKVVQTVDNASIERILNVTIDEAGEIIKITHSR